MADVKTDSLNTSIKTVSSSTAANIMTVEKQTGQANQQSTSKNRTVPSKGTLSSANDLPPVAPAQLKVASGNNSPVSPKKIDPKGPPVVLAHGAGGAHPRSQGQQPAGKNKGNPWHKPSPPSGTSAPPKGQSTSPEAKATSEVPSSLVQDSGGSSRSISIPNKVWSIMGDC